jgi:hypothetical protein
MEDIFTLEHFDKLSLDRRVNYHMQSDCGIDRYLGIFDQRDLLFCEEFERDTNSDED